jgi:regulatory protein
VTEPDGGGGVVFGPRDENRPDTPRELKARALRLLMRRDHGREELVRQLTRHAESPEVLEALLDELVKKKLLSEDRVAESRAHTLSRKFGASRIQHDLRARGIADETIERVTQEAKATEVARASEIWKRKFREPATSQQERAKQMRFLAARGFSHATIKKVMSGESANEAEDSSSPEEG